MTRPGHVRKKCSSKQLAKVGELCEEGKAATLCGRMLDMAGITGFGWDFLDVC